MRYLGVVAGNIKYSYLIMRELKRLKIPFELLGEGEPLPPHLSAIISCSPRRGCGKVVVFDGDARSTVLRALSASTGRERFREVVVGIDPGESTGVAIIADGGFVETYVVARERLGEEAGKILETYPAERFLFRVGRGRSAGDLIPKLRLDPRARVELVEETRTELPPAFRRRGLRKDAKSALAIALSGGGAWIGRDSGGGGMDRKRSRSMDRSRGRERESGRGMDMDMDMDMSGSRGGGG